MNRYQVCKYFVLSFQNANTRVINIILIAKGRNDDDCVMIIGRIFHNLWRGKDGPGSLAFLVLGQGHTRGQGICILALQWMICLVYIAQCYTCNTTVCFMFDAIQ